MWPCRTRPSTSPTATSRSTSGPRSSPAAISPRRSPARSSAMSTSRKGLSEGFDDVVVRVGVGAGRKVRFTGSWSASGWTAAPSAPTTTASGAAARASTSSTSSEPRLVDGRFRRQARRLAGHLGIGDVRYGSAPKESTLEVVATVDELRDRVPPELFDMVARPLASRPWRSSTSSRRPGDPGRCP